MIIQSGKTTNYSMFVLVVKDMEWKQEAVLYQI